MVARGLAQPLRSSGTSVRVAKVTPARVSARRDLQRSSNDLEPEIGGINQRSVRARGWSALTQIVVMINTQAFYMPRSREINRARSRLYRG